MLEGPIFKHSSIGLNISVVIRDEVKLTNKIKKLTIEMYNF